MFTGIISSIGTIISPRQDGDLRLAIACDFSDIRIGESIACNGACLTVVSTLSHRERGGASQGEGPNPALKSPHPTPLLEGEGMFTVTLSAETVARTALGQWQEGKRVNLERALKLGDALDGHLVTGHVDGVAMLKDITPSGDSHILALESPASLARFIAEKGSITLDGVSLTVNKVENCRFWVNIIPHTWRVTTLSERKIGDALNLEVDVMARYAARLLNKEM